MNNLNVDKLLTNVKTPFYVFDINVLKDRVLYLKSMLPSNVSLCYAMKANPFIVKELDGVVEKFEVCSFGEYKVCDELNVTKERLVISGVYKDEESIREIMSSKNVGFYTVESLNQLMLLDKISKEKEQKIDVLLRLTSGNQFGIVEAELEDIIRNKDTYSFLNIRGIEYFSGTQKTNIKRIEHEVAYLDDYVLHLKNDLGYEPEILEFGAGFPIEYFEVESKFNEEEYLNNVKSLLENMNYKGSITLELGRSIAATCGTYFTKVVDTKTNKEGNFAILDGGMHQLVYYGQMMAMKRPKLEIIPKIENEVEEEWNLCGALCTINDLIVKKMPIKGLKVGDIFAFKNTGAYSMTEGISLFLSRDLPSVVFLKDDNIEVVREHVNTYSLNMPNGRSEK